MEILLKEEAYDIFISYKETDSQGKRTQDSVLAQEIYQQLTREGYKVFFSRISLEDKVGMAYEPYIFAALNSAKVMLLVGTSKENLNSVWVRNEWSRFMSMQKEKSEKQLFPVYRDMNPYDLPDELLNLQAQDMSRIGAMQDLLHGLEKALKGSKHSERTNVQIQTSENANIENLLRRIEVFLQEGNIAKAQEYCEKILDIKIDEARVYIAQLRMVLGNKYGNTVLKNEEEIFQVDENISKNPYFRKAMNYAQGNYLEKLHELEKKNDKYCYVKTVNHVLNSKVFDYGTCNGLIVQFIGVQNDEKWKNLQACVNT